MTQIPGKELQRMQNEAHQHAEKYNESSQYRAAFNQHYEKAKIEYLRQITEIPVQVSEWIEKEVDKAGVKAYRGIRTAECVAYCDGYEAALIAEYLRSRQHPGPVWKMFAFEKPPKMVRVVCRNMNTGNITGYINAGEKQWHPSDEFEWLDESGSAANTESQDKYLPDGILAGPAGKILLHHLDRLYDGFNSSMLGDNEDRVRAFILGLQEDLRKLDADTGQREKELCENDAIEILTDIMRAADHQFETTGGGTRHYIRDLLLPMLREKGIKLFESQQPNQP